MNTCTMCSATGPATCDACLRRFLDYLCEQMATARLEVLCLREENMHLKAVLKNTGQFLRSNEMEHSAKFLERLIGA
jgi:hypothetical protein